MSKKHHNSTIDHKTHPTNNNDTPNKEEGNFLIIIISIVLIVLNVLFVVIGFFNNRPTIQKRLHEACLWESGYYRKVNCDDAEQSECVPLKNIYPNSEENPFSYIIEDNPHEYSDGPIEWDLGDVSICICLDGYNVHKGTCQPGLIKWHDAKILSNLLCSILLILTNNSNKKNDYCYLIICILLLVWGVHLGDTLQDQYADYD